MRCQPILESATPSTGLPWARFLNTQAGFHISGDICIKKNYSILIYTVMLSNLTTKRNTLKFSSHLESTKRVALCSPLIPCRCFQISMSSMNTGIKPIKLKSNFTSFISGVGDNFLFQALEITKQHLEFPQLQVSDSPMVTHQVIYLLSVKKRCAANIPSL